MSLSLTKAFTYVKKDPKWSGKILVGGILPLIPSIISTAFQLLEKSNSTAMAGIFLVLIMLLALMIIAITTGCLVSGYYVKNIKERIDSNDENLPLPEWKNLWQIFILGLKYNVGYFLYCIPLILVFIFIFLVTIPSAKENPLLVIPGILVAIIITILALYFLPVMTVSFVKDLNVFSFVNYVRGANLLQNNLKNYITLILYIFLTGITVVAIVMLPFMLLSLLPILLIPSGMSNLAVIFGVLMVALTVFSSFVQFYAMMVYSDLLAQFGKTKKVSTEIN